jgi:hypothetical protein
MDIQAAIYASICYLTAVFCAFVVGQNSALNKANRILAQRREKWLRVMARRDTVLGEAVIDTTKPIL